MTNISLIDDAVTVISRVCEGFWGYFFSSHMESTVSTQALNNNLESYRQMLGEIDAERTNIRENIEQMFIPSPTQSQQENSYGLFSKDTKPSLEFHQKEAENRELIEQLHRFFDSYPQFSAEQMKIEPGYITRIQEEIKKHHEEVKALAIEYFKRVDCAERQRTQLKCGAL